MGDKLRDEQKLTVFHLKIKFQPPNCHCFHDSLGHFGMNRQITPLLACLFAVFCLLAGMNTAEAKRMGGGSSFGSRPSYNAPYQRQMTPAPHAAPQQAQPGHSAQQQAAAQNQAARQGFANRGGFMGLLGGLALGGLLGSLFFGGAFEGINFMDILLFAGLGYLVFKLLASRAPQQQPMSSPYGRQSYEPEPTYQNPSHSGQSSGTGFNTDLLFGKDKPATAQTNTLILPEGFETAPFLKGAESAYRFLQSAWDHRDLAGIRGLTTDKVFAEIQDQLRATDLPNQTEIVSLKSELLDIQEVGSELEAAVLFDCTLRENNGTSEQVQEVWHFIKNKASSQTKWYLDGIQQVSQ